MSHKGKPSKGVPWWYMVETHLSMQEAWVQLPGWGIQIRQAYGAAEPSTTTGGHSATKTQRSQKGKDPGLSLPGACSCTATPQPWPRPLLEMLPLEGQLQVVSSPAELTLSQRLGAPAQFNITILSFTTSGPL